MRPEEHRTTSTGWLRAAVLGANDGLISTASLVAGVAAAGSGRHAVLLAGVAGLIAGAMSMAAGEYVSVSSQADSEKADLARERRELATDPVGERSELMGIYVQRGLSPELAAKVADELMSKDALAAHARDELGMTEQTKARPLQAAIASAASFTLGALLPVILTIVTPESRIVWVVTISALVLLAVLGALAAKIGGANIARGALRVAFWGAMAMAFSTMVGRAFETRT
jgi:VIT1/CCC1 family predicted Fe2+/Mn2+ transporter